jgi:hypothetical protein
VVKGAPGDLPPGLSIIGVLAIPRNAMNSLAPEPPWEKEMPHHWKSVPDRSSFSLRGRVSDEVKREGVNSV